MCTYMLYNTTNYAMQLIIWVFLGGSTSNETIGSCGPVAVGGWREGDRREMMVGNWRREGRERKIAVI